MKKKLYQIGDIVFLKVDDDIRGICTGVVEREASYTYLISIGEGCENEYYAFELVTERSFGRGTDTEEQA